MALELRAACERCGAGLAPESRDAWICFLANASVFPVAVEPTIATM